MDDARELLALVNARLAAIDVERSRLVPMRQALEAFIEQPPADPPGQSGAPSVAPVSGPDDPPAASQPGQQSAPFPGRRAARASQPRRDGPAAVDEGATAGGSGSPAASSIRCDWPECERTFDTVQRMGAHRFQAHVRRGHPGQPASGPAKLPRRHVSGRSPARTPTSATAIRRKPDGEAVAIECPTCHDWFRPDRLEEHRAKRHNYRPGERTETYLCGRCPEGFPTLDERLAHEATHPPLVPTPGPVGRNPSTQRRGVPAGVPIA